MINARQEFKRDAIHGDKSQSRVRWRWSDDDWIEVGSVGSAFGAGGKVLNGDTEVPQALILLRKTEGPRLSRRNQPWQHRRYPRWPTEEPIKCQEAMRNPGIMGYDRTHAF